MKCFAIASTIILLALTPSYRCQVSHEISLDAISLISSQFSFLEDMCYNRTANLSHFDALEETVEECQREFLNGTNLSFSLDGLVKGDPKEFYEFYSTQCNSNDTIQRRNECNDKLKNLLSECLNETEIEAFNKIEDIARRLHEVACSIDETKIQHFFSPKGQECMIDNVITIGFCFLTALPDNVAEKQELLFKLINGRECKVIEEIENCIMSEIDACDEKTVSSIFRLLFEFFRSEISCNDGEQPEIVVSGSGNGGSERSGKVSIFMLTSLLIAISYSLTLQQ